MNQVITSVLGVDNVFFNQYLYDNISLAKSIVIKNETEASLYNTYVDTYRAPYKVDYTKPQTWRYYKHLVASYHEVDTPMTTTSLDTGKTIVIDKSTINLHTTTKTELLKFTQLYDSIVKVYPEQELLLRSIISDNTPMDIQSVIDSPNYSIVSYSNTFIEPNEDNLIPTLQDRLYNYSNIWFIPYYSVSDSLFTSTQTAILYNYLVTTLLAIRQENCKKPQVHSFHVKNYLASNFGLDQYYNYMTSKQAIYLYLNILYLKNHSGMNYIFKDLVTKLFNDRNISVVNYQYNQLSELATDNYMNYTFRQQPIGSKDLLYSTADYTLDELAQKEESTAQSNANYYLYNKDTIDYKLKNTLFNTLLSKDLETILIDATDSVPNKFIKTLVDNWVYMLKNSYIQFLTKVTDKINNKNIYLDQEDTYKLYVYLLHKVNNIDIKAFPTYVISRIYKDNRPEPADLMKSCYITYNYYKQELESIITAIPLRPTLIYSPRYFADYITNVYIYDIALWLYLSNLDDMDNYGQFKHMTDNLTTQDEYTPPQEDIDIFLNRIGLADLPNYQMSSLQDMLTNILDNIYDNKLGFLTDSQYIQKAMTSIFENFKSYTIQLINTYYVQSPVLCGVHDTRYKVDETLDTFDIYTEVPIPNYELQYKLLYGYKDDVLPDITSKSHESTLIESRTTNDFYVKSVSSMKGLVIFNTVAPTNIDTDQWVIGNTSDDDLLFLALNKIPD